MNENARDSVQIVDSLASAAGPGSVAQLKRLLAREESRFRALAAAADLAGSAQKIGKLIQENKSTEVMQAQLEAVCRVELQLRKRARKALNYEGLKDNEKLKKEYSKLSCEVQQEMKRSALCSTCTCAEVEFGRQAEKYIRASAAALRTPRTCQARSARTESCEALGCAFRENLN
ncbi:hypothetical protein ENH_00071460 [Eimeria necatrix]|uniref:Uncharacterized protein n=1 Tax=Eimeria necatrix TaxID=51315 RepID=U6MP90_9EIME|nr:hypothetical protein ENH_00071460 [Eimeria necatrix]CDJ64289.1 hypothetical protein ENH_00071460 [Eimeria necatrix]